MSFQWLKMRITEEKDRREREQTVLERLPRALEELHKSLFACMETFTQAFGPQAGDANLVAGKIKVVVREEQDGRWQPRAKVEIATVAAIPGFQVDRGTTEPLIIEVGMLPGDRIFFRDRELDQYLTMEEVTRRILDRALFPKLKE